MVHYKKYLLLTKVMTAHNTKTFILQKLRPVVFLINLKIIVFSNFNNVKL